MRKGRVKVGWSAGRMWKEEREEIRRMSQSME